MRLTLELSHSVDILDAIMRLLRYWYTIDFSELAGRTVSAASEPIERVIIASAMGAGDDLAL